MKKCIVIILFFSVLILTLNSCKDTSTSNAETIENTEIPENSETYQVNTQASLITWKGFKPTGSHDGTLAIENGTLNIVNNTRPLQGKIVKKPIHLIS